jgi:hypothetical protein
VTKEPSINKLEGGMGKKFILPTDRSKQDQSSIFKKKVVQIISQKIVTENCQKKNLSKICPNSHPKKSLQKLSKKTA